MMEAEPNIRIEYVGDINSEYAYLDVFYRDSNSPFLEIGITSERQLSFKFYANPAETDLTLDELEKIINTAKEFLPAALKNEDDFRAWQAGIED